MKQSHVDEVIEYVPVDNDFHRAVNETVLVFMIGIVALFVSVGCRARIEFLNDPTSAATDRIGNLKIIADIVSAMSIIGCLAVVASYASRCLAWWLGSLVCQTSRYAIGGISVGVGLGVFGKMVYKVDWPNLISWHNGFVGLVALFSVSACVGFFNAMCDLIADENSYQRQIHNES